MESSPNTSFTLKDPRSALDCPYQVMSSPRLSASSSSGSGWELALSLRYSNPSTQETGPAGSSNSGVLRPDR